MEFIIRVLKDLKKTVLEGLKTPLLGTSEASAQLLMQALLTAKMCRTQEVTTQCTMSKRNISRLPEWPMSWPPCHIPPQKSALMREITPPRPLKEAWWSAWGYLMSWQPWPLTEYKKPPKKVCLAPLKKKKNGWGYRLFFTRVMDPESWQTET